ncbi:MAG: polysaccharide biosynthesis tyrosine autokinase [Gemmatimonadota bacterium]|nr:polysaccharide biosynthesis tyrosine autokinase [Gemmatimonadota bacterium]
MSEYLDDPNGESPSGRAGDRAATLAAALSAIRRRWWLVAAVFAVVVAGAMWRTIRQPRLYETAAVVQLEQSNRPLAVADQRTPSDWRVDPVQSAQEIIKSQEIAERVAHALGLRLAIAEPAKLPRTVLFGETTPFVDSTLEFASFTLRLGPDSYSLVENGRPLGTARYGLPVSGSGVMLTLPARPPVGSDEIVLQVISRAAAARAVRYSITTRARLQTNIIEVAYKGTEPLMVQRIANGVAQAYREFSTEERRQAAHQRTDIIQQSLLEQQVRLDSSQASLQLFKEREQLSNVGAEQQALIAAITQFEGNRDEVLIERAIYEKILGRLAATDTSAEELRRLAGTRALEQNAYISNLYDRWYELLKQRSELVARGYTSRNRDVRSVDSLIVDTKDDLREASSLYLQTLQSRLESVESRIASLRDDIAKYPSLEAQESRLVANLRMVQSVYEGLLSDYQRARIAQSIDETNVRIIDEAARPTVPVSPNRRRALLTAIIFGTLLGLGAAVAVEQLDNSVKSPDEMRDRFDLAVLGTIPEIKDIRSGRELDGSAGERLVTHLDPRSPVAEAYRSLRTNLAFARAHQALRTIVLTSPGPSDGKSTTVANLAITFAQQGQRTLLIDADLRRAVLDKLFDVPRSPGLTDVLVGQAKVPDVVRETAIANLSVLGSGSFPPNPSELLGSSAMRDALSEASGLFDIVLLDSPPLLAVTDAAVLATMVDAAVLIVRMGATPRASVRRSIAQLQAVHGHLVGAVLNDVDFRQGGYGAGYGYYYYYYYGQDGHRNGAGNGVLDRVKRWTRLTSQTPRG